MLASSLHTLHVASRVFSVTGAKNGPAVFGDPLSSLSPGAWLQTISSLARNGFERLLPNEAR